MRNNRLAVTRGRFVTCPGTPTKFQYDPKVNDDGTITLTASGTIDTDEHIEAQRRSTELSVIISKFLAGDESVLNRYSPSYADLTQLPKTLAETLQLTINAEREFDRLPVEIKQRFGSDWHQWFAQFGSSSWMEAMSPILPKAVQQAADLPGQAPATAEPPAPKRRKAPEVQPLSVSDTVSGEADS